MIEAIIFDWIGTLYQFRGKGLFPYSERVLKELSSKYKLAVISKVPPENLEIRLKDINEIKKYFYIIIVDTDKTQEQFTECMRKLNVKPENTLVVGDRTIREIKPGNELGCKTVWIQKGDGSYDSPNQETGEPDYRFDSIKELLNIL